MTAPIIHQTDREIYSVSSLTRDAKQLLEQGFGYCWIKGELASVSHPSSGHVYFTLKDDTAGVRCALFRMNRRRISFPIENGIEVMVYAKVSLYEPRGDFQLIVSTMEEVGSGLLARQFELLKAKLATAGLFAPEHKKPLPTSIQTIGVITSSSGAALRDVLRVLSRRSPQTRIIIYPTLVQGKSAANDIINALKKADTRQECDVLLLTRGGGSQEDLWCFNDEQLAHAIFSANTPIVSAVGHEVDFSISDFVADLRVATPSAGAEILSQDQQNIQQQITAMYKQLSQHMRQQLQHYQWQLDRLRHRLPSPIAELNEQSQRCDYLERRLRHCMQQRLDANNKQCTYLAHRLHALSPLATLDRGYTLVQQSGTAISSLSELDSNQAFEVRFRDGHIQVKSHS